MKIKNEVTLLLSLTASLTLPASAAIISIDNMAQDDTTVSGFTVGSAISGTTMTLAMTRTGNLDGGTLNDTLSFDLIYTTYTGSTFDGTDVTLGTAAAPTLNNRNWHSNQFAAGNTLSLEVTNIVYTDGEGDETVSFNGFTSIMPTHYHSAVAGNVDYYVGLLGVTTVTGDPTFDADLTSSGTGPLYFTASDGPVRLRALDFQFKTSLSPSQVPEPSSVLLIGLGITSLIIRRRR